MVLRVFSLLMGDGVEVRRNFIAEHALGVKDLDVQLCLASQEVQQLGGAHYRDRLA